MVNTVCAFWLGVVMMKILTILKDYTIKGKSYGANLTEQQAHEVMMMIHRFEIENKEREEKRNEQEKK